MNANRLMGAWLTSCLFFMAVGPANATSPPAPGFVELRAVGKTFEGPSAIPHGWTTFRFVNASPMVHFALIDRLPEGVTVEDFNGLMVAFQAAMDAMNSGDAEAIEAAFGRFPAWVGDLARNGGPGFLSAGMTGEATVYLEPGQYVIECYVKSDGIFHTTPPGEGVPGMVLPLTVSEVPNGRAEPSANATVTIRNDGFELTDGALNTGRNTLRVEFAEQQAFPSFVGNDIHIMRVDGADDIARADGWFDWRLPAGLEDPAPVTLLGGLNDLAAGEHGYITVDLDAGDYALIAEVPAPAAAGLVLPFSVGEADPAE